MARLEYQRPEDASADLKPIFAQIAATRGTVGRLYQMLMNSPEIARGWLGLGTAVRQRAKLNGRIRELVILQVGRLLRADYQYTHHYDIALRQGVTESQIGDLARYDTSTLFDERERAALRFAKVSTVEVKVPDEVFEAVRRHFDPQEIVELTVTVGFYNMVCRFIHTLGIDLEPESPSRLPGARP